MLRRLFSLLVLLSLTACGIQAIPQAKNEVDASWAEVENQYKRRADLVPNLVEVVKGYAGHERETLQGVTEARAKATSVTIAPNRLDDDSIRQFQRAQGELSTALGRLMVVVEKYPDLKANQNFRDLQVQLEGTENRITIARQRYIESVKNFNNQITVPPNSFTNAIIYRHSVKPQFSVEADAKIDQPPAVKF